MIFFYLVALFLFVYALSYFIRLHFYSFIFFISVHTLLFILLLIIGLFLREGGREISETLVSEVKEVVNSWLEECCSFSRSHGNGIIPSSVLEYLEEKKQNYLESCDNNLDDREALLQWNIR